LIRLAYWLDIESICFQIANGSAYQVGSCVDTILIALDCAVPWQFLIRFNKMFNFNCFIDYVFCFYGCDFFTSGVFYGSYVRNVKAEPI